MYRKKNGTSFELQLQKDFMKTKCEHFVHAYLFYASPQPKFCQKSKNPSQRLYIYIVKQFSKGLGGIFLQKHWKKSVQGLDSRHKL